MEEVKTTETPQAAESPASREPRQFTKIGEDIGEAAPPQPVNSPRRKADPRLSSAEEASGAGQFSKFGFAAKFSQRTWLVGTTVSLALVTLLVFSLMAGRNRAVREKAAERAVETVTPEIVIAGCGQAAEDVTKDLYPVIMRTMSYKPGRKTAVVLQFSRTAEENSQWVFLSMQDENGTMKYETPQSQIAR